MKVALALIPLFLVLVVGALARPQASGNEGKRLIRLSEKETPKWITNEEVLALMQKEVNFMDITDHPSARPTKRNAVRDFPTELQYGAIAEAAFAKLSIPRMTDFITKFSAFRNRYYTSATGAESSNWLLAQAQESIDASDYAGTATVEAFAHSWLQNSVIARIEGSDPTLKSEVVILGAHQDSVNLFNPSNGVAPGADDDASGSVVLLEAFRSLLETGFIPKRTIEFQWYSAEEVGLRGSQDIASAYFDQGVNVVSMVQLDVVGYFDGKRTVGVITDYTDNALSAFIRTVVDGYLDYSWTSLECGYACSDHASFDSFGFPAAFPVEIDFSPYMHSVQDTIDTVNFEQCVEFAKLAVGYSIEMAEPQD